MFVKHTQSWLLAAKDVAYTDRNERDSNLHRLMDLYGDEILRFCCWRLGDRQLAEDAAQDTFLSAYRALDRFRRESSEKTWLFRIAKNRCTDLVRQASRRAASDAVLAGQPVIHPPFVEDVALEHERRSMLYQCMARLDPDMRTVAALYYFEDWPAPQIARVFKLPVGTVRTRIRRAKSALAACLGGGWE